MKPILFLIAPIALVGGLAGGHFAAPTPEPPAEDAAEAHGEKDAASAAADAGASAKPAHKPKSPETPSAYAKLDKQFVVPVVENDAVAALVVVNMALEVDEGATDMVYLHEPKLRDEFLTVLFNHARSGAFMGGFIDETNLADLRASLNEAAVRIIGDASRQVLLTSIIKQDM